MEQRGLTSIRDLKTFLLIAESGSFIGAARASYRTQSAVTAQVHGLEQALGVTLFDRATRPPKLTEAGRALIPRGKEVVAAYEALFQGRRDRLLQGSLQLGVVPSVITGLMPLVLRLLAERHPGLRIEVRMGLSADLVASVRRNLLNAAVISDPLDPGMGLTWSPFLEERMVLIAPPDAPAKNAAELLRTYPFIRYTRQAWVGRLIDRILREKRLVVRETMLLDTLEAVAAMVHAGLGVAIVPKRLIEPAGFAAARTVALPGAPVVRTLGVVEGEGHAKGALTATLIGALRDVAAQAQAGGARRRVRKR